MRLIVPDPKTADRLADAGQLLLDAARSTVADHVAVEGNASSPEMLTSALAMQTLLAADQWPAQGLGAAPKGVEVDPALMAEKLAGAALGLGLVVGQIPEAGARAALVRMVDRALARGIDLSRAAAAHREAGR